MVPTPWLVVSITGMRSRQRALGKRCINGDCVIVIVIMMIGQAKRHLGPRTSRWRSWTGGSYLWHLSSRTGVKEASLTSPSGLKAPAKCCYHHLFLPRPYLRLVPTTRCGPGCRIQVKGSEQRSQRAKGSWGQGQPQGRSPDTPPASPGRALAAGPTCPLLLSLPGEGGEGLEQGGGLPEAGVEAGTLPWTSQGSCLCAPLTRSPAMAGKRLAQE